MNRVAIVQARMGSSRLPGKVLQPLCGLPLIEHVLRRLERCTQLDRIVVATTTEPEDDQLVEWLEKRGTESVRGPAENVLQRFGMAARLTRAGVIARITADSPLVDPEVLDGWIQALCESGADTLTVTPHGGSIHEGMVVFSRAALDRLLRTAPGDPVAREHVNAWFAAHPQFVTRHRVSHDPRHLIEGTRISVDTPADMRFLEALHSELGAEPAELDLSEVVQLLRQRPELLAINAHVRQKKADEVSRRILLHCPDEEQSVLRALQLGQQLRDIHSMGVTLALTSKMYEPLCEEQLLPVLHATDHLGGDGNLEVGAWLAARCRESGQDALLLVDTAVNAAHLSAGLVLHWGAGSGGGAVELTGADADEAAASLGQLLRRSSLAA